MTESHNYTIQRNYKYESYDENGNFLGITEDEWKDKIRDEWTCDNLKANYVVYIFHDKDIDEHGAKKDLHVHGCVNFKNSISKSNAVLLSGCSTEKNCSIISKKANAYRYLLHITDSAIKAKKHIYDEDCLELSIDKGKTFDYKKAIQNSEKEDDEKHGEKLIQQTIDNIVNGVYGDGNPFGMNPMLKICENKELLRLMSRKNSYRRQIENAIELKTIEYNSRSRANNLKSNGGGNYGV